MSTRTLLSRLGQKLREFQSARAGNVALTFAIATIPIIGAVGAAVDYSHANSVKAALQSALDSTALMISKELTTDTADALQADAVKYFNAMFTRPEAKNVTITATYSTTGGSNVVVSGSADVPTSFMGIMGYNSIPVSSSATAKWGSTRLRVALVLDNTGSMVDNGKIGALKTATNNLLTQLQGAATTDGDVYVSIIPFSKDVRVDATGYSTSWDSWIQWDDGTDSSWNGTNGSCSKSGYSPRSRCTAQSACSISGYNSQNSCTSAGNCSISGNNSQSSCTSAGTCSLSGYSSQSSCTSAGVCSNAGQTSRNSCTGSKACSNSQYTSQNRCTSHGGTWGYGTWSSGTWTAGTWTPGVWTAATWTPNAHTSWNGCITDRGSNSGPVSDYDRLVTEPTTSIAATLFPAEQYNSCAQSMMGLSYDWTAMATEVSNMQPNGSTNQPIALVWGWQSLVGGGPLTAPALDPNYQYQQVIILLSDGLNTQDRWYGNGSTTSTSVDYRMYDSSGNGTCANIKAAGITIYTIQVNTGGDPTSTLLQNCASSPDKFFLLTSASEIVTAFNAIGTNLTKLRVAK